MHNRKVLLAAILRYEHPELLPKLRQHLKAYVWDSDEELVTLTKENIISILDRYLRSELTAKEVEDWADAIDQRDDVKFGMENDDDTIYIVGDLANPVKPLSPEYARSLIKELGSSS